MPCTNSRNSEVQKYYCAEACKLCVMSIVFQYIQTPFFASQKSIDAISIKTLLLLGITFNDQTIANIPIVLVKLYIFKSPLFIKKAARFFFSRRAKSSKVIRSNLLNEYVIDP